MTARAHDFSKHLPCPECGEPLFGVMDSHMARVRSTNPAGVLWVCRKAIGELAWDREWRRQYFPAGSIHRGHLRWYIHNGGSASTLREVDRIDAVAEMTA